MAVTVKFLADVASWISGLSKSSAAVEENEQSLEDLMRQVIKLGTETGHTADEIAADFSKAFGVPLDKAKAAVKEVQAGAGDLGTAAAESGAQIDEGITAGAEGAGASMSELGGIAKSVLAGDVTGAADAAGEALGAIGPIAGAVGLVISAVVSVAAAAAEAAQEKLQATRDAAGELAAQLYENGGKLPIQDRVDTLLKSLTNEIGAGSNPVDKITDGWRDYGTVLDAVRTSSKLTGIGTKELLRGLGGSDVERAKAQIKALDEQIASVGDRGNRFDVFRIAEETRKLTGVRDQLQLVVDSSEIAEASVDAVGDAYGGVSEAALRNAAAIEQEKAHVEDLAGAWQDAMVDASDYFTTTEDGATAFVLGDYLKDAVQAIADANAYKAALVGLPDSIQEEAERVFADAGASSALAYVNAYSTTTAENQSMMQTVAAANGTAVGTSQGTALATAARTSAQGLIDIMGPINQVVKYVVDDSAVQGWHAPLLYGTVSMRPKNSPELDNLLRQWG